MFSFIKYRSLDKSICLIWSRSSLPELILSFITVFTRFVNFDLGPRDLAQLFRLSVNEGAETANAELSNEAGGVLNIYAIAISAPGLAVRYDQVLYILIANSVPNVSFLFF